MTFDASEKTQSQLPALQLLVALGFRPLSQADALRLRGGRRRNVVLDDILVEQLLRLNRFTFKGREYPFDLEDAHEAIRKLKPSPDKLRGLQRDNQDVYDNLILGTTIAKTIEGDTKSYSLRYIDWERPENNAFHVTAEFEVERTGSSKLRRCDIVAFVNGIPFVVIENKRPSRGLEKSGASDLIKYQGEDNIPQLFHFAQLLMSMKRSEAKYATVGTPARFWSTWRDEEDREEDVAAAANRPLTPQESDAIYHGEFTAAEPYFAALAEEGARYVSEQDKTIYALCRPERLLDLTRRFTVFDGGIRKIARHQQYFGIREAVERVKQTRPDGRRRGGVIWHTQGSGKSLTMVMLGKALALEKSIASPRIMIVTDRDDLDKQIRDTFKACELDPVRAKSGGHLLQMIENKTPLVTTIINKFETATRGGDHIIDEDPNLFVLIDESHRSQTGRRGGFGQFALKMRRMLPKACYLGFTGTPLMKPERSTLTDFGGLIHRYTIDQAVRDGAVVPLLYEGRYVEQQVSSDVIDKWFEKLSDGLSDEQKADLKLKFSRLDAISKTGQVIRAKAFDISEHYRQHWQGTGFKAQLVAPSKASAVRFKQVLDEIGHVTSEIIISAPDDKEGNEDVDVESADLVRQFWARMMSRYGGEDEYNRQITEAFKGSGDPEILIVVSKLLTGFDAPRNTVLYVCKSLREHNLLQAIARVNRLYEVGHREKEFGIIVDYEGLLGELDAALTTYSALEDYEPEDLAGALHDIREELRRLPQLHDQLWDLFRPVANKKDMEQFEVFLGDEPTRQDFYQRLAAFSRCLHLSLSSEKLLDVFDDAQVERFKRDWKQFQDLKRSVQLRYQEKVDIKAFEPKIQKLLDDHVTATPAEQIIELVNINDPDALTRVVEETGVSAASRADRIASATSRTITERMETDPSFYRKFSEMLRQTIEDYRAHRISEKDYLARVADLAGQVADRSQRSDVPEAIAGDDDAQAMFGLLQEAFASGSEGEQADEAAFAEVAAAIIELIRQRLIVGLWTNDIALNELRNEIDDYFFDVAAERYGLKLTPEQFGELESAIIRLSKARFPT